MIRAILFDFYGVWTPDRLSEYLSLATQQDPANEARLRQIIEQYYMGLATVDDVTTAFRIRYSSLPDGIFQLRQSDISPVVIDFMRYLHSHFLKIGVLANLGKQERDILTSFNTDYQLLEMIVGSIDVGGSVLSQEAFVQALQGLGEPPDSCLAVAGSDEYQRFAESCGVAVLRFQSAPQLRQALIELVEGKR